MMDDDDLWSRHLNELKSKGVATGESVLVHKLLRCFRLGELSNLQECCNCVNKL